MSLRTPANKTSSSATLQPSPLSSLGLVKMARLSAPRALRMFSVFQIPRQRVRSKVRGSDDYSVLYAPICLYFLSLGQWLVGHFSRTTSISTNPASASCFGYALAESIPRPIPANASLSMSDHLFRGVS